MSQESVEVVLRGFEAIDRQDADAFVAHASSDVEWVDAVFWSEPVRTYRGSTELREWFERVVVEPWESIHVDVDEIIEAAPDRVVTGGLLTARGRGSGVGTQVRGWSVYWVAGGKVRKRQVFLDRDEALEAAGLSE
jgi:ketosteroid isomerase-like protein